MYEQFTKTLKPSLLSVSNELPDVTTDYGNAQLAQLMNNGSGQQNVFPNWLGNETLKGANFKTMAQFYANVSNATESEKIALANQNPTLLQYDTTNQKFKGALGRDINGFKAKLKNRAKNIGKSVTLGNNYLTQQQIEANIPNIVKEIVSDNDLFSKYGIGPISRSKFPLYAGRWMDPITGALKILPKASNKYINPASYDQQKEYLEARVLNKWNEFVGVVEQVAKFQTYDKEKWEKNQIARVTNKFEKEKEVIGLPSRIINEYKRRELGFPLGNGGTIFWKTVDAGLYQTLANAIKTCVTVYQEKNNDEEALKTKKRNSTQAVLLAMDGLVKNFITKGKALTPKDYSSGLSYGYNLSSNKIKEVRNTLLKISKIMNIPQNLSELDVNTLETQLEADKLVIAKVLGEGKGITRDMFQKIDIGTGGSISSFLDQAKNGTQLYSGQSLPSFKSNTPLREPWKGLTLGKDLKKYAINLSVEGDNLVAPTTEIPEAPVQIGIVPATVEELKVLAESLELGKAKLANNINAIVKALTNLSVNQAAKVIQNVNNKKIGNITDKIKGLSSEATSIGQSVRT